MNELWPEFLRALLTGTPEAPGATYGDVIGAERIRELTGQYLEVIPDDGNPNGPDFQREVTSEQARELGAGHEAWFAYTCLHYFAWRDQLYCRICGSPVLAAWMFQHRENVHTPRFGF